MNTSHDFGPGAIVHPVHPHEDDPHDGAGADPHDERMRGRELVAVWCALLLASWTFVAAVVVGLRTAWRAWVG